MTKFFKKLLLFVAVTIFIFGCNNYTPEEQAYITQVEKYREKKDSLMEHSPTSPFNYKGKVEFHPLNYYDVDPGFVFKSKLVEYDVKDTLTIFGTKGEERTAIRFGYLPFTKDKINYKLNIYKNIDKTGDVYFSTWFTDKTTNEETYGVGRYLEFDLKDNPDFIYTIDFNLAFNPYCAYSSDYSCAIPSKKDFINLEITAGEKKYHD